MAPVAGIVANLVSKAVVREYPRNVDVMYPAKGSSPGDHRGERMRKLFPRPVV